MFSADIGPDALGREWTIDFDHVRFIWSKPKDTWLDYGVQLAFYKNAGRFPLKAREVNSSIVDYIRSQLFRSGKVMPWFPSDGRTERRRRLEIKELLKIERLTASTEQELRHWLTHAHGSSSEDVRAAVSDILIWCVDRRLEAPSESVATRLVNSVRREFDTEFLIAITDSLNESTRARLTASLEDEVGVPSLSDMKTDPGRIARKTILAVTGRLSFIQSLDLSVVI